MTPQRRDEPDRAWVVWAVVGVITLALCVVVVVVVGGGGDGGDVASDGPVDGRAVCEQSCANCHAVDGAGAVGPQLADGRVAERYPDDGDLIEVIAEGRPDLGMPPFADALTDAEIAAVAEYVRTL
ncbi:MAG TPA: cytochrome c [Acidimicrobiales bacterium]|nr:cytochrome c [Acidimicrobiales bacterium]